MRALPIGLILLAVGIVGWVRLLPLSLDGATRGAEHSVRAAVARELAGEPAAGSAQVQSWIVENPEEFERRLKAESDRRRAERSFETASGKEFPYLGGFDSYVWLRAARNILRHGSACDSIVDGQCRDDFTLAPVGVGSRYAGSLHVGAIAGFHCLLRLVQPEIPLSVSAYFLSYFVALLGVFPAFWLGSRFGGAVGGFVCSIVAGLNGTVLYRTFGADNDVWNVVFPLFEVWAVVEAMYATTAARRVLLIAFAAAVTGAHAATWAGWIFTAGVVMLGLGANAMLWVARLWIHGSSESSRRGARRSLILLVGYLVLGAFATTLAGAESSPATAAVKLVRTAVGKSAGRGSELPTEVANVAQRPKDRALRWPSVFETVGELRDPSLAAIARSMAGPMLFFVAWLGMILLMLPRRNWQSWHFMLLVGGNLLYRFVLTRGNLDPYSLALVLLIPLAMGIGAYLADRSRAVEDQGAGATIILWFLGGLVIAHQGNRYLLLLAPPMAILCAVAVGRLYEWFARQSWSQPFPLRPVAFVVLAATVWLPVQQGRAMARNYVPMLNDDWHGLLERLRTETPPDTIVNSWWDYGYFIKYYADRRVLADGGVLRTQVHHWLALALMSPDPEESLGILRMLNCGSAAFPEPEGTLGAFGRLLAAGVLREKAYATVLALAPMERSEADRHLRRMGLSDSYVTEVLERTHCRPAPGYLVLPSALIYSVGWRSIGSVTLVESVASSVQRRHGPQRATAALIERFGLGDAQANDIVRSSRLGASRENPSFARGDWIPCVGESEWRCATEIRRANGDMVVAVLVDPEEPRSSRVVLRSVSGGEREEFPTSFLVAGATGLNESESSEDPTIELGLLIDLEERRVLLGSEQILRSTFTSLVFLDGRYLDRFESFDRRGGNSGRITTWKIEW